jgi:hypothetical protein
MGQTHDHSDVTLHTSAWHFELTDHHALAGSPTHSSGAHVLDKRGGWLFAAVYGGEADAEGGFFVFNVSDAAHPKEVGRYRFAGALGGDRSLEATDDANFVVLGTEPVDCAGHVNPFAPGLYLIDVRDKTNPTPVDHVPLTSVHTVTVHRIAGEDYVFAVTAGKNVFHINRAGPRATLERIGELPIGHDAVVADDAALGKPLLYASNGGGGFDVWDVSKPAAPQKVAAWNIPDRPKDKYYIHSGAVATIEGRRIAVVTTEDWKDYPSELYVLDATNLSYIETLSTWHAPGDHAADGLRYSMHNQRFLGSTLLLSYYHGGVWALDLSTQAHRERPVVVGQYTPDKSNGWKPQPTETHAVADTICPGVFHLADAPLVFDVEPGEGVVYAADMPTGLYTLKPTW